MRLFRDVYRKGERETKRLPLGVPMPPTGISVPCSCLSQVVASYVDMKWQLRGIVLLLKCSILSEQMRENRKFVSVNGTRLQPSVQLAVASAGDQGEGEHRPEESVTPTSWHFHPRKEGREGLPQIYEYTQRAGPEGSPACGPLGAAPEKRCLGKASGSTPPFPRISLVRENPGVVGNCFPSVS